MIKRFVLFTLGALLLVPACSDEVSVPEATPDYSSPEKVVRSYFDWSRDYLRERQIPRMEQELNYAESLFLEMMPGFRSDLQNKFEDRLETLKLAQKKVRTLGERMDEITFEVARRESDPGRSGEGSEFRVEFDVTLTKPTWDESAEEWRFETDTKTVATKRVAKGKWKLANYEGKVPAWLRDPFISQYRVIQRSEHVELVPGDVVGLDRSTPESLATSVVQNFHQFDRANRRVSLGGAQRDRRTDLQVSHWMSTGVGNVQPSEEYLAFLAEHQDEVAKTEIEIQSVEMRGRRSPEVAVEATSKYVRPNENAGKDESPFELAEHTTDYMVRCNKISGEWYALEFRRL